MLQAFMSGPWFWLVGAIVIVAMHWFGSGQTGRRAGLLSESGPWRDARRPPHPDAG
jgi:hypothetical protein